MRIIALAAVGLVGIAQAATYEVRTVTELRETLAVKAKAGDEIVLADGTYTITNAVTVKAATNLTIRAKNPGKAVIAGSIDWRGADFAPLADKAILTRLRPEVRGKVLARKLSSEEAKAFVRNTRTRLSGENRVVCWQHNQSGRGLIYCPTDWHYERWNEFYEQPHFIVDGRIMPKASWPNVAYETPWPSREFLTFTKTNGMWRIEGDRPAHWKWDGADIWMEYHSAGWATSRLRLDGWNAEINALYSLSNAHVRAANGVHVVNVLEEIDAPGEWCFDAPSATLCLLPPKGFSTDSVCSITVAREPFLRFSGCSGLRLDGLLFTRKMKFVAVILEDGTGCEVRNCRFTALGGMGLYLSGWRNRVADCSFDQMAHVALTLFGGSSLRLEPGGNVVERCTFADAGLDKPDGGVVTIKGCGNVFRGNFITNAPGAGLMFNGPDQQILSNRIMRTTWRNNDLGALYGAGDMLSYGSRVVGNEVVSAPGYRHGIYLDDFTSGIEVRGNFVHDCGSGGIFLGGGRDLVVVDNVISNCSPGIHNDNRGLFWPQWTKPGTFAGFVKRFGCSNEWWTAKHPQVAKWCEDGKWTFGPVNDRFEGNVVYGAGGPTDLQECRGIKVPEKYLFSTNNVFYRTSRFNRPVKFWRAGGFELKDLKPEK